MKEIKEQEEEIKNVLSKIKNKFIVMSGKGGVGKSFVAAHLAVGLAKKNYKVGLLDIDVHGPSIPKILGLDKERFFTLDNKISPISFSKNLKVISIGFLLRSEELALIWRGPMKTNLIKQFISEVVWNELDYLIIDSPPGTGDEPLTVAQSIVGAKAIIVTTPQDVAILDVKKSIAFCRQLKMGIIGIIENMSGMICPKCGEEINVFKKDGGKRLSEYTEIPFLGKIPLSGAIVELSDKGVSLWDRAEFPESILKVYSNIIDKIIKNNLED
jgi:Mrp family chromosome partitioning ATPase